MLARGAKVIDALVPEAFVELHDHLVEVAEPEPSDGDGFSLGQPRSELDVAGFEAAERRGDDARAALDHLAARGGHLDTAGVRVALEVTNLLDDDFVANIESLGEGVDDLPVPTLDHAVRSTETAVGFILVPVRHGNLREGRGAPVLQVRPVPPQQPPFLGGQSDLLLLVAVRVVSLLLVLVARRLVAILPERLFQLILDDLRERHLGRRGVALAVHAQPRPVHQRVPVPFHASVRLVAHEFTGDAVVQRELIAQRLQREAELSGDRGGWIRADAEPRKAGSTFRIRLASRDDTRAHVHGDG